MQSKVSDEMDQTRRAIAMREKALAKSLKKRAAELLKKFAPGLGAGWQIDEEEV
jgi:hypothetical protein